MGQIRLFLLHFDTALMELLDVVLPDQKLLIAFQRFTLLQFDFELFIKGLDACRRTQLFSLRRVKRSRPRPREAV